MAAVSDAKLPGRSADKHSVALESAYLTANKRTTIPKHVVTDVISIRPNAHLRIVVEIATVREGVAEVGAGRIGRRRNGDTLSEWLARHSKLSQHPAIGQLIVLNNRIAIVIALATNAEALHNNVTLFRTNLLAVYTLHIVACYSE